MNRAVPAAALLTALAACAQTPTTSTPAPPPPAERPTISVYGPLVISPGDYAPSHRAAPAPVATEAATTTLAVDPGGDVVTLDDALPGMVDAPALVAAGSGAAIADEGPDAPPMIAPIGATPVLAPAVSPTPDPNGDEVGKAVGDAVTQTGALIWLGAFMLTGLALISMVGRHGRRVAASIAAAEGKRRSRRANRRRLSRQWIDASAAAKAMREDRETVTAEALIALYERDLADRGVDLGLVEIVAIDPRTGSVIVGEIVEIEHVGVIEMPRRSQEA